MSEVFPPDVFRLTVGLSTLFRPVLRKAQIMYGEELRAILDAEPNAQRLAQDNNEYLVSYRFDTGAEIAFDPRTITKCSIFVDKIPERMRSRLGQIKHYPPEKPSSALARVSPQLASTSPIFKIDLPTTEVARDLLAWIRWA